MIERIMNFLLLIKEELQENMGGILAMVMGVLAALYTIWLTLTYLPPGGSPSLITPTPITPAPSYLEPTPTPSAPSPTPPPSSSSTQGRIAEQNKTLIVGVKIDLVPFEYGLVVTTKV